MIFGDRKSFPVAESVKVATRQHSAVTVAVQQCSAPRRRDIYHPLSRRDPKCEWTVICPTTHISP